MSACVCGRRCAGSGLSQGCLRQVGLRRRCLRRSLRQTRSTKPLDVRRNVRAHEMARLGNGHVAYLVCRAPPTDKSRAVLPAAGRSPPVDRRGRTSSVSTFPRILCEVPPIGRTRSIRPRRAFASVAPTVAVQKRVGSLQESTSAERSPRPPHCICDGPRSCPTAARSSYEGTATRSAHPLCAQRATAVLAREVGLSAKVDQRRAVAASAALHPCDGPRSCPAAARAAHWRARRRSPRIPLRTTRANAAERRPQVCIGKNLVTSVSCLLLPHTPHTSHPPLNLVSWFVLGVVSASNVRTSKVKRSVTFDWFVL